MSALSSASAAGDWCSSAAAVIRQRLALRRFSLDQRCCLEIAPAGSHLGFGVLAGDDLHIEPLLDAE